MSHRGDFGRGRKVCTYHIRKVPTPMEERSRDDLIHALLRISGLVVGSNQCRHANGYQPHDPCCTQCLFGTSHDSKLVSKRVAFLWFIAFWWGMLSQPPTEYCEYVSAIITGHFSSPRCMKGIHSSQTQANPSDDAQSHLRDNGM